MAGRGGHEGQQLGNYRLLRLLGRGGFAEVYLGEHIHLSTPAAIKILHTQLTREDIMRFRDEARTIARLSHPHIVRVLDFAVEGGTPFLVMEYAPGGKLRKLHPSGTRLQLETIVSYVQQVASALQHAHDQRLIHRDVKPENMLLGAHEEVLLSDFGLAVLAPRSESHGTHALAAQVAGTSLYLAPEQLHGHPCPASDQYALAVVVYEWLCGRAPFRGTLVEIAMQHLSMSPPPLRKQGLDLSTAIEEVVLKALTKEPEQRFASVQDFASALEQACHAGPVLLRSAPSVPEWVQPQEVAPHGEAFPPTWNVPFRRNPFFTGRETLLTHLHEQFTRECAAAFTQPYALSGLGGIGKTQLAIEYAYRFRDAYRTVLWVRAASRETLVADFVSLASLLQLPERDAPEQRLILAAVKRWLACHTAWLLILDNADDLALAADFLPTGGEGHVLLTTRTQATGKLAKSIAVEQMELDEGMLLLLRRAKLLAPDALLETVDAPVHVQAQAIVRAMDGLPLALDQAGAYIEETGCGLSAYLELYQWRRADLLNRQSNVSVDYPHTVASTWSLSFEQVEQESSTAADLLRLCAFLAPDAIPEAIVSEGAAELGPVLGPAVADPFLLNEAIQVLRRYSLLKRDLEMKLLNLHRLVQAVLKDGLDEAMQRQWAERTVRAVHAAFPTEEYVTGEPVIWSRCEQCLPHVQVCMELINQYGFTFPEAARLLRQAGWYLYERGLYGQAEPLYQRALAICEQVLGPEHPDTARTLNYLASLHRDQGQYAQAEPFLQRALAICEQVLGSEHPRTANTLNHLALLYHAQSQYAQAEPLYQRALTIYERVLGPEHPDTATAREHYARLLQETKREHAATPPEPAPSVPLQSPTVKPPSPLTNPDDLTAREVEVLRLVAQGWTDAQIAVYLVISPRTVSTHLTSIYRKIQVSSRSAATRYAIEQHLV